MSEKKEDSLAKEEEFIVAAAKSDGFVVKFNIFDPKVYKNETRHEIVIVSPNDRITSEYMSSYEHTDIVGTRAKQIEDGGPCFVVSASDDPVKMAEEEIRQKKCPLSIMRKLDQGRAEIWEANEMVSLF